MKRLCIVIDVADERPNLLLEGVVLCAVVQSGGELRSAYVDPLIPQTVLDRALDIQRKGKRHEIYPPHPDTQTAGLEPAKANP